MGTQPVLPLGVHWRSNTSTEGLSHQLPGNDAKVAQTGKDGGKLQGLLNVVHAIPALHRQYGINVLQQQEFPWIRNGGNIDGIQPIT